MVFTLQFARSINLWHFSQMRGLTSTWNLRAGTDIFSVPQRWFPTCTSRPKVGTLENSFTSLALKNRFAFTFELKIRNWKLSKSRSPKTGLRQQFGLKTYENIYCEKIALQKKVLHLCHMSFNNYTYPLHARMCSFNVCLPFHTRFWTRLFAGAS